MAKFVEKYAHCLFVVFTLYPFELLNGNAKKESRLQVSDLVKMLQCHSGVSSLYFLTRIFRRTCSCRKHVNYNRCIMYIKMSFSCTPIFIRCKSSLLRFVETVLNNLSNITLCQHFTLLNLRLGELTLSHVNGDGDCRTLQLIDSVIQSPSSFTGM